MVNAEMCCLQPDLLSIPGVSLSLSNNIVCHELNREGPYFSVHFTFAVGGLK